VTPRLLRHARGDIAPLARNKAHRFAADHALAVYGSGAVYSFVPKNACSTLRLSLAIANGAIAGPQDWTWIHHNNATFRADLRDLARARFTFVVLRCPHARLASVFLDKIVGRRPEFWTLHRLHHDRPDPETLTFRDFVTLLETGKSLKADIHWRPQADFLVYEDYDAWIALEDFAAAVPLLTARAGLTIADARPLTGHGTDRLDSVSGDFADTPLWQLAEMRRAGRVPNHGALYDPGLAARVAALYQADMRIYAARFGRGGLLFPGTLQETDLAT